MVFLDKVLGKMSRGGGAVGWGISIGLHVLLGVGFLVSAWVHDTSNGTVARPAVKTTLLEPMELLEVEPVVNDLRIEPMVGLERADTFEPVPLPEVEPVGILDWDRSLNVGGKKPLTDVRGSLGSVDRSGAFVQSFCGFEGEARRICYVVDCSGSMVVAIEYVRQELKASLRQLSPAHYFQILFYSGSLHPVTMEKGRLLRATRQNLARALKFVDEAKLSRAGSAGAAGEAVAAALAEAFAAQSAEGERTDLIYLLTDGEFDQSVVATACRDLQKRYPQTTKIYVVGCGNKENKTALRKLSRANRGRFRFVGVEQLDAAIQTQRGR